MGFLKAFISKYKDVSKALITIEHKIQLSFIEVIGFLVTSVFKYAYNSTLIRYSNTASSQ